MNSHKIDLFSSERLLGEHYIPDFSNWKDHDAFEKEFAGFFAT